MSYIFDKASEFRIAVDNLASNVNDNVALKSYILYPDWEDLAISSYTASKAGYRFKYGTDLYKTINDEHTFAVQWIPGEGTESLYVKIEETHVGTLEDPIPYTGNMVLENGKYYSQNDVIYLCNRNSENPVYNDLSELVDIYVTII